MKSTLLFLVHFKIFLGLQSSIGILQHLLDFFFANWLWMFMLIALSSSIDWLWISLPDWLLIHYLYCWWWFECIFFWISWRLIEVSFQHDHCTKGTLNLSKFINHSWDSVHSTNLINFDFHDHHLFAIRKVRWIVNCFMLREYFYQVKSWLSHLNLGRIC